MKISVIIATYNRGEKLARTLRSLAAQTLPAGEWEAVVVNNNSTDDTAAVFGRFAASEGAGLDVRMVDEVRQGLSWARNRGLEVVLNSTTLGLPASESTLFSSGGIVVMIDDDEEVNPEFLAAYRDFFAAHPSAVAAGGPMVACYEEGRPPWMSHYTEALAASTIDLGPRVRRFPRGRYPIGGNMAFRREVFDNVGVFDVALGRTGQGSNGGDGGESRSARHDVRRREGQADNSLLGGEEKDLFERIAAVGGEIWWVPRAAVDHLIPPSRVTDGHFRRLSRMVGVTARTLSKKRGGYVRALAAEAVKWGATLMLAAWFVLSLRPAKARYLIIMRREISRGLCGNQIVRLLP